MKNNHSRRTFFRNLSFLGLGAIFTQSSIKANEKMIEKKSVKYELRVASYGFRKLSFEEVIKAMQILGIKNISLKSMHLPFDLSEAELKERMKILHDAGINPYAPGVVYMRSSEDVEARFKYCQAAGFKMMVAVPDYELLDQVEEKIKETGIRIAIHTHGPDNQPYSSPEDAFNRIKDRDSRLGICADLGHVLRNGMDPVQQIKLVKDRLFDVHIRDVSEPNADGIACRPGSGVFDFKASLQTLIDIGYNGYISIEYEQEEDNPIPAHAETKGYINGMLAGLR